MTRSTGPVTTRQAVLGGMLVLAVLGGFVAALGQLLERDEQAPPLPAPADPEVVQACPQRPPDTTGGAVTVSADQLVECPALYDRVLVRYRGEVVRAVLPRGDRAWVHLNDDPYALELGPLPAHRTTVGGNSGMPVSIPAAVAEQITHVGDGHHRGDILEVVGTYRRADPADGGGPAIQADAARVDQVGHRVARTVAPRRVVTAIAVAMAALAAAAAARLGGARPR